MSESQHSIPNRYNSTASTGVVSMALLFLAGFVLFIPSLDTYMMQLSDNRFFNEFGLFDSEKLLRWYGLVVAVAVAGIAFLKFQDVPKNGIVLFAIALSLVTAFWGAFLEGVHGKVGIAYGFRQSETVAFYILAGFLTLFSVRSMALAHAQSFFCGTATAALVKLTANLIGSSHGAGAVALLNDVTSVQADGQLLLCQCLVGVFCVLNGIRTWRLGQKGMAFGNYLGAAVMFVGVALSFRRLALLQALLVMFGALIIDGWVRRQSYKGFLLAGSILAGASCLAFVAAALYFGEAVFVERLRSISLEGLQGSGNSAYDGSNKEYLDHWDRWPKIVNESKFLGMGFETGYGGSGPIDAATGDAIPLHVGSYEMAASLGIVGVVFWAFVLVGLPLYLLKGIRDFNAAQSEMASGAAAWVLFTAFCPFGPPFFTMPQSTILIGCCLGFLVNRRLAAREPNANRERTAKTSVAGDSESSKHIGKQVAENHARQLRA